MSNRKSDKKVEKVAWFMANFQCVDLDDSSFERIRELLSHCRGSKTRVALSKTDGWKSGKNSLLHKHKKKKVPLSCIHNLIQDEKFINVLLCVFAVQCADSDDPKLEVVAFKFRSPEDALDIVTRFREWTDTLPLEGSVNESVLISRSTAMPMPGRPTTGNLTPSQWTSPSSSGAPRPYLSSSANDLTSAGVFYGHQQPPAQPGSETRRVPSSDRRTLPSEDGSVVLSETDMNGIAVARVNGGLRNGSLSPEFDDIDNSTLPIHLVYARPPSTSADHRQAQHFTYSTTRKERYHSTDGVTLNQPADVRSPVTPTGRYYLSSSRSDVFSVGGGGSRVVPASRVVYRPSATLINPRFNKNKQYMPRSAGVVGSRSTTSYRAVPRSRAGSDWH